MPLFLRHLNGLDVGRGDAEEGAVGLMMTISHAAFGMEEVYMLQLVGNKLGIAHARLLGAEIESYRSLFMSSIHSSELSLLISSWIAALTGYADLKYIRCKKSRPLPVDILTAFS